MIGVMMLSSGGRAAANPEAAPLPHTDQDWIVRLYYQDMERLAALASRYDVFEHANHEAGYVDARLRTAEFLELQQAGYRVDIDAERTARANQLPDRTTSLLGGIPGYECYRTVEETFSTLNQLATNYPGLVTLVDIGDSWEKMQPGGAAGYDLLVMVLSSKSKPGPKPRFFLMAEHHARELTTSETALRFAEDLLAGYGTDADATWLLDYYEIHILPVANPDGRKWAEQGYLWRKNTSNTNGCGSFPDYGTDLNRNCGFKWGGIGSSSLPCDLTYRGPEAVSEPENQAIQSYVRSIFPDQRGPADTDPAPATTTGLVISLHSYSQLVLYPWGWTTASAPNVTALKALGCKFGYYNRYAVQASTALYATTGSVDDWVYGELGVPSYTFEMGTDFFQGCAFFQTNIYPANRPALYYAFKACRQPYLNPAGPEVTQVTPATATNLAGAQITLNATADDARYFGAPSLPIAQSITAARYSVDAPSWIAGSITHSMTAADGGFNSSVETLTVVIDTTGWSPGRHTLFVEAQDANGQWGVPTAAFVWIEPFRISGTLEPPGFVVRWPSVTNKLYTLLQTTDLRLPFTILANNLVGTPPTNSFTNSVNGTGARFFQIRMEP